MHEDDWWFQQKSKKIADEKYNISPYPETKLEKFISFLNKCLVVFLIIHFVVLYIVIFHFNIIDSFVNASMIEKLTIRQFIPNLGQTEPYAKSVVLGFIFFIAIVFYSINAFISTLCTGFLYDGDFFVRPLIVNSERRRMKYSSKLNTNGWFYKFFIAPDEISTFFIKQQMERRFSIYMFTILGIFFLLCAVYFIDHPKIFIEPEGFSTKFEQLLFWFIFSSGFAGASRFVAINLYGLFIDKK